MAILLKDAMFESHICLPVTQMRRETKRGLQEIRSYRMEVRNSALSVAGSSCRCTLDSSREPLFYRPRALPPGLLFPPLGPGSNVFRGIGIEFRDRSFFRRLFDIVDIISNDLLCLRVVDHHRFRTRRI